MTRAATKQEKPKLIGARIYNRHRKMIAVLSKAHKLADAEIVRRSIELMYARYFPNA